MHIHSSDWDFLWFGLPYAAKELLNKSIQRTSRGFESLQTDAILAGSMDLLVGRVQSIAAFSFVALSTALLTVVSMVITPCFLIPASALNLVSRAPGISSFETMQQFTRESDDAIYRVFRVHMLALPVLSLFLLASGVNTILPGGLTLDSKVFSFIEQLVAPLGPLKTIHAVVPGCIEATGTETNISLLEWGEEFLRALSNQNVLKDVHVSWLTHIHTSTTYR